MTPRRCGHGLQLGTLNDARVGQQSACRGYGQRTESAGAPGGVTLGLSQQTTAARLWTANDGWQRMHTPLHAAAAVAKISKYASRESGDTVEVIERPRGGISLVLADGQRSGLSAKVISNLVVQKAISLLAEGVRDGAVARATHDYLHVLRGGKVSAELTLVSVDLLTRTLVVSRNSRCPSLLRMGAEFTWLDQSSEAIGVYQNTKPSITEFALQEGTTVVAFSDGIWGAGARVSQKIDLPALVAQLDPDGGAPVESIADGVLDAALTLDQGRPLDDATVVVVKVTPAQVDDGIRRMKVDFPLGV